MKIFLSAPKGRKAFRKCVEEVARARNDECIYCPEKLRQLKDAQLLEEVKRELVESHIVLMDLSMRKFEGDEWYPNSGVMIEFGLVMNDPKKGLGHVHLFCDKDTQRDHLPPMIPRAKVQEYSEDSPEELKTIINKLLDDFLNEAPERERKLLEAYTATTALIKYQVTYGSPS